MEQDAGESAVLVTHARVRQAILSGELEAGSVVSQLSMAKRLGVTRTPLREALRLLQREGLIEARSNRRVRIAPFSTEDLEQMYALRITVEALALRLTVPGMTDRDVDELERCLAAMETFEERRDAAGWEEPHRAFHRALGAGAGSRIVGLLDELNDHAVRYRRIYLSAEPIAWSLAPRDHAAILDGVRERDEAVAAERLARHLGRTALTVLLIAAPDHEPRVVRTAIRAVTNDAADAGLLQGRAV
jgi:DNA-binding GntR family transcriptional regulator